MRSSQLLHSINVCGSPAAAEWLRSSGVVMHLDRPDRLLIPRTGPTLVRLMKLPLKEIVSQENELDASSRSRVEGGR